MKNIIITVVIVVAVIALVFFIYTKMKAATELANEISEGIVATYVQLLQEGEYGTAWETCLSEEYKKENTKEEFVAAHRQHVEQYGAIESWQQTIYENEGDLFSSENLVGIRGILHYENRDVWVRYGVDSNVKPYRIKQILASLDTSDSLSHQNW